MAEFELMIEETPVALKLGTTFARTCTQNIRLTLLGNRVAGMRRRRSASRCS